VAFVSLCLRVSFPNGDALGLGAINFLLNLFFVVIEYSLYLYPQTVLGIMKNKEYHDTKMYTLKAVITGGRDSYGVWIEKIEGVNGLITSAGNSVEEVKKNLAESIDLFFDDSEIPECLMDGYEIDYTFDFSGYLKYISEYISFAALKKITGVAQKQLWNYANGYRTPKKETVEKILNNIKIFNNELSNAHIHF
jgi:predicted RNase H-like HicB family nuclease